jgi:hypothetical protein
MSRFLPVLLWFATVCCAAPSRSATWVVDPSGEGDFTSIQPAVDAASGGDTVQVRPGTYQEWVRFSPDKGGVRVIGDGSVDEIVVEGDTTVVGIWSTDPAVRLENLTLTGSSVFGAMWIQGAKAEIVDCVIRGNVGPGGCHGVGGGGRIINQSDVLIEGCVFEENHSWESPGGLIVWSSRADIRNNVFRNNSSCYGGGLEVYHCEDSGVSVVEGNLFLNNYADIWGGGLFCVDSSPEIRNNTFGGNSHSAIWVLGGSPNIHHNIIVDSYQAIHCQSYAGYPPSLPVIGDNLCWEIDYEPLSDCPSPAALQAADPLFCDASAGDYHLCANSPAAEDGLAAYGALGVGCGDCELTPVQSKSWGAIKRIFGDRGSSQRADSSSAGD